MYVNKSKNVFNTLHAEIIKLSHVQLNPFIMTSKGHNKQVILSGRHTKHFAQNKQTPVFVSMYLF